MLKLWGLSWLTAKPSLRVLNGLPINHIIQGETEAVRSRTRRGRGSYSEAEARQWNTEAAGMRPRHQHFLPRGSLEVRRLPRGLHHWRTVIRLLGTSGDALPDCLHRLLPGPSLLSYSVFVFSFSLFFVSVPLN